VISIRQQKDKVLVEVISNGKSVRNVVIYVGEKYIVNPLPTHKTKHKQKIVVVNKVSRAIDRIVAEVTFLDTMRPGKIDIEDLDYYQYEYDEPKNIHVNYKKDDVVFLQLVPIFRQYLDVLKIIDERKNKHNLTTISQNEISSIMKTSSTNVSKKIKELIKYRAIEKMSAGCYRVIQNDIDYTPYRNLVKVIELMKKNPELRNQYKDQAEVLNITFVEVQQAWGFIMANSEIPMINEII
jgi:hypothetical protein